MGMSMTVSNEVVDGVQLLFLAESIRTNGKIIFIGYNMSHIKDGKNVPHSENQLKY